MGQGGVAGRVDSAAKHLNMFTKDSTDDVFAIKLKLQQTQDKVKDQERLEKKQESRIRELRSEQATLERKIQSLEQVNKDLQVRDIVNKSTDVVKEVRNLEREQQQKAHKLGSLLNKAQSKRDKGGQEADRAVRASLQRARRNINIMQKIGDGIYKLKKNGDLIMVELDPRTNDFRVSYVGAKGQVQLQELAAFVSTL